ncbi:MAG TPA: fibronectin type III domain-containing protein [Candidatus Polarisedimenticolaceae bacterium]|nr:fibronectin type III domain-containing protein [Candidatus Polarisedimenticolaceae bacterium]
MAAPVADLSPPKPGTRLLAVTTLTGGSLAATCITPSIQSVRSDPQHATAAARRSINWLATEPSLVGEKRMTEADGTTVRFTVDRSSLDRVEPTDDDGNGRPDVVDAAAQGIARAQRWLVGQLELPNPGPIEIVLARLGSGVEGFSGVASARTSGNRLWLDPAAHGGLAGMRRAAEHQYAHLVASLAGLDPAWGESLAAWTTLSLEGAPDGTTLAAINRRLAASGAGLIVDDLELATGNAAFLAYLEQADGASAVKVAVDEMGKGGSASGALDRAVRRVAGQSLDEALRDFQLWSLLTGVRDDHRHFSFASRLQGPAFAATADDLPALSVQADPEVAPLGSAAILIHSADRSGGLDVRFEGDVTGRWGADLLLVRNDGTMHRVPLPVDADQSAEITVPLQGVLETLLLVRNLDGEGKPAHRYTWGAHVESRYPVEIADLHVEAAGSSGARVSWQTDSESGLLGFNVFRSLDDDGSSVRVNPVWIPAVGREGAPAAYSFLDPGATPGVSYRYRIEAVTPEGLTSRSDAVALSPAP